jgi:Bardet-Biedl syndrome 1 protein
VSLDSFSFEPFVMLDSLEFTLLKENNLTDLPCAVVACYMDNLQPRIPGEDSVYGLHTSFVPEWICLALAVASGSAIFLFKALRPYYKFLLPQLEIAQVEKDVWSKAREVSDACPLKYIP